MGLGIKIAGEFLDLLPGTVMQLEESNPFLQLTNEIVGQYSLPFTAPLTDKNIRLLNYASIIQTKKESMAFPAIVYDGNLQHSQGIVKVEQVNGNINFTKNGTISLYYLYGIADFYQLVKDKRLIDIDYGVKETYLFTGNNITDDGFRAHLHKVMFTGTQTEYPYAIFEVNNPSDIKPTIFNDGTEVDKNYNYTGLYAGDEVNPYNPQGLLLVHSSYYMVWPYLLFVLKKIFASVGWKLTGDVLSDPDFLKINLLHSQPLPTNYLDHNNNGVPGTPVLIDLNTQMPNVTVSGFLTALKTRMGWWYDFDFSNKICEIRYVKDVFSGRDRKDYSKQCAASYLLKVSTDPKIYTLSATMGDPQPDWTLLNLKGQVAKFNDLPALVGSMINDAYFVVGENSWYSVQLKSDDSTTEWQKITGNTYGYENPNSTDQITTNCNIPDMNTFDLRNHMLASSNLLKLIPTADMVPGNAQTDVFYICYNQGQGSTYNIHGLADTTYPLGSPGPYDAKGNRMGNKTLSFLFKDLDGSEIGIYTVYWKPFLDELNQQELATFTFYFDIVDLLKLDILNSFVVNGTEWFIQTIRRNIPYAKTIEMDCIRL